MFVRGRRWYMPDCTFMNKTYWIWIWIWSLEPNIQQTECPLTNRLSYRWSSWKLELNSPPLRSASIQPTRPHCRLVLTLALPIYMSVVIDFNALAQASDFRFQRRHIVFLNWMQDSNQGFWKRISSRLKKMIWVATLVQFYQFCGKPNTFPCR